MDEAQKTPVAKKPRELRPSPFMTLTAAVAVLIFAAWMLRPHPPIPARLTRQTNFAIYYPSTLPAGYKLDSSSPKVVNNILFYSFAKGKDLLYISQQVLPQNPPDLKRLTKVTNFKTLPTSNGNAVLGTNDSKPTAILLTATTMINVNASSKDIPSATVQAVTTHMRPL